MHFQIFKITNEALNLLAHAFPHFSIVGILRFATIICFEINLDFLLFCVSTERVSKGQGHDKDFGHLGKVKVEIY